MNEKEREHDLTSLRKEIATLVSEKCVDPETQRPYPVGIIEKAMAEAGFSVKQGKTAKSQVSECIKMLQTESSLPIQRARMRIKVTIPAQEDLKGRIVELADKVEHEESGTELELVSTIHPLAVLFINFAMYRFFLSTLVSSE